MAMLFFWAMVKLVWIILQPRFIGGWEDSMFKGIYISIIIMSHCKDLVDDHEPKTSF